MFKKHINFKNLFYLCGYLKIYNILIMKFFYLIIFIFIFYNAVFSQLDSRKFTYDSGPNAGALNYEMLEDLTSKMFEKNVAFFNEEQVEHFINISANDLPQYSDEELHKRLLAIPTTIPLKFTPQVGELIRYFSYKKRAYTTRMLTMSQVYFPIFEEALEEADLPLELKCLSVIESALNPLAKSRVGATGLWQFMHGTAKYEGMEINTLYDSRSDIYISTEHAVKFLKKLHNLYGDWFLALAAYNAGPGNVNKAIKRSGGYDFWTIKSALPRETQNYVPSFIAMVYMMYYAKDYQLFPGTPKINIKDATFYKINEKQSLKYLAELSGTDEETLKIYNPALKKGIVPKTEDGFSILLPRQIAANLDKKVDLLAQDPYIYNPAYIPPPTIPVEPIITNETLAETPETVKTNEISNETNDQKSEPVKVSSIISNLNSKSNKEFKIVKIVETKKVIDYHKVRKGENATEIARKYQISLDDLSEWNKKANLKKLLVGSKLKIEKTIKEVKPQLMPVQNKSNHSEEEEAFVHKLKKGETLLQLTRKYNVSLNDLRAWNNLEDDNVLIGQEIKIKTEKSKLESNTLEQYFIHIAKGGDTLQSASNLYNVPLETLKKLNNIPENAPLKEGEKIKIPSS